MTLNEVYLKGKSILSKAGIDTPAFDAMCIFNFCFKLSRQDIILYRNKIANEEKINEYFSLIKLRKNKKPLQYILGQWSFMGMKFKVGEGVLIPRDDTEVLVTQVLKLIENIKNPRILDLCAGSGTIAVSLAKKRPDSQVTAIELSDTALQYLNENITLNNVNNVIPMKINVLSGPINCSLDKFNVIVSNPPYIPTKDIKYLQMEVKYEPIMALDGGYDGLNFYRAIANKWLPILNESGFICMEVGIGQSRDVMNIFNTFDPLDIYIVKDLNNIERVVVVKLK